MFDFDYRLECTTREPKRTYGFFVLPILCQGELIGCLDAKAHRADGVFEAMALVLAQCARWHDTATVRITQT